MHRLLIALIGINLFVANLCIMPMAQAASIPSVMMESGIHTSASQHSVSTTCDGTSCMTQATGRETAQDNLLPFVPTPAVPPVVLPDTPSPFSEENTHTAVSPTLLTHTNTIVLRE